MKTIISLTPAHVGSMVRLIEQRRAAYETVEPVFWRRAPNSAEITAPFLEKLLVEPNTIVIGQIDGASGDLDGFLIAREFPAPPVYAPGGKTLLIDDFCAAKDWQSVAQALLADLQARVGNGEVVQVIVICGHHDQEKAAALQACGLRQVSGWWRMELPH